MRSDSCSWLDEYGIVAFTLSTILLVITLRKWKTKKHRNEVPPLPPGPRGLPLVGYLPFLEPDLNPHFSRLAKIYGPVFSLKLGTRHCIVLSSPSVAKEVLKDHDATFGNHDAPAVGIAGSYGGKDLVWAPCGEHWRMLRKVCVTQLLSNKRLESLYQIRQKECRQMVNNIRTMIGIPITIHDYINATLFDTVTGMLWGGLAHEGDEKKQITSEFRKLSQRLIALCGEPNISDFIPFLARFDLQRKEREMKILMSWFDRIFDELIEQRLEMKTVAHVDFLQVLLQCRDQVDQKNTPLTTTHIKALLMDMIIAGTRTASSACEWALAELMQRPHLMKRAREELERVVGLENMVEETHIPKLPYTLAIMKEALRLHPPAPLLVPKYASSSCVIGGYSIPKGARILINAWAIHRDPKYWDNPSEFRPERFMDSNNDRDLKGTNFSYIPFGSGRRVCVGIPLAERMVPYLLASLLHSFSWKLPEGTKLDMSESFGAELVKKIPLVVIPMPS